MKIAIISDIHSNLLAFNLAINDAKKDIIINHVVGNIYLYG